MLSSGFAVMKFEERTQVFGPLLVVAGVPTFVGSERAAETTVRWLDTQHSARFYAASGCAALVMAAMLTIVGAVVDQGWFAP
jgi:hypothetical protein